MLDEEHRKLRADFYGDVFGFDDLPMLTDDRKRQVFQVHNIEQFVFLIADDPPMTCPRLDHFGLSVGSRGGARRRSSHARKAWQERDDRVDIIDKKVDDHGMLAITSIYVRYLLPMMVEIQWWDYKGERESDARDRTRLRYGAFAPQGWKLEYTGWGAADAWERTKELAQLAEQLGYDHLWVYDHVETVPRREPTHVFEAFTTLAALAQHTTTIKLGQLVTCAAYRNAGLLAKEAACVDVFSGGRLILGLGAGWYEREYQAYGYPVPERGHAARRSSTRRSRSSKRLWTEETVTFQGKHLAFDGAYCDPKPIQQLPEIWVGGGGEKVTLRIAARHADKTNWQTARRASCASRSCSRSTATRSAATSTRSCARTAPTAASSTPRPTCRRWLDSPGGGSLWGRGAARRVRARQLRRHRRAGRREGAGLRRRRLPRVRALVPRLPVDREPRSASPRRSCPRDQRADASRSCYVFVRPMTVALATRPRARTDATPAEPARDCRAGRW